jgi:hypothetical protein
VTVEHQLLPPRLDLRNHSPVLEWDATDAGPLQLALALLADYLEDDERALATYQEFRRRVVSKLPTEGWVLTGREIDPALQEIASRQALRKLEKQLGVVLQAVCRRCGKRRVFCGADREIAEGHAQAAGWVEVVDEDETVYRLCPECEKHQLR